MSATALLPGFTAAPRHDPLHDAAVEIEESGCPDANEALDALDAIAAAADRLRALATGASDTAVRRAAETARGGLLAVAEDLAADLRAAAEDYASDGWRAYGEAAQRAYEARRAREDA